MYDIFNSNKRKTGVVGVPDHIKFNKEQKQAIEDIRDFLLGDEEYYVLKGKGGTGKTTVIAAALKGLINIIGIAIAHKASERLSESVEDCYTFASACAMKAVNNDSGGKDFVENTYAKRIPIQEANIIVIDECSQISKDAIKIVHRLKRSSAKVIYMGDFRQHTPIDGTGLDSKTFKIKNSSNLIDRVRQGVGNPIIELSDVISEEIETKRYNPYVISEHLETVINSEGKGYEYLGDSDDFIKDFVKDFKENDSTKFICFKTNVAERYNKLIREEIYGSNSDVFIEGELLVANDTFYQGDSLKIKNSVEYYVKSFKEGKKMGIPCYFLKLEGVDGSVPVLKKSSKALFNKKLKEYSEKKMWKNFWPLKDGFAQIDYGYAINSYKSQGSTYRTVYAHINEVLNLMKPTNKDKCHALYVIISRASHKLKLLDI